MTRFVEGSIAGKRRSFPECLADWIDENNPVRVIDAFVDKHRGWDLKEWLPRRRAGLRIIRQSC